MSEIVWRPVPESMQQANMTAFIRQVQREHPNAAVADYPSLYRWSIEHPERFWLELWEFCGVISSQRHEQVLEHPERMPGAKWFPEARLNYAENLLRRRDGGEAIVFRGEAMAR